jgi:predicted nucleotidyltransferase
MTQLPLQPAELELVRSVLRQHPEVVSATLFGSRAKGTHSIGRVGMVIYPEPKPQPAELP